jgi:hypothetical protein
MQGESGKKAKICGGIAKTALAKGERICHSYKCADEISQESARKSGRRKTVAGSRETWQRWRREVPLTSRLAVGRGGSGSRPKGSRGEPPSSETGLMKRVFPSCFREQTHGCNPLLCERAKDERGRRGERRQVGRGEILSGNTGVFDNLGWKHALS